MRERVFVLNPDDGKFDGLEESFLVSIKRHRQWKRIQNSCVG